MDWLAKHLKMIEIRDQIKKVQKELSELREVVSDYQSCQSDINLHHVYWSNRYKTYTGLDLYSTIQKQDLFEGQSAEELGQIVPEAIEEMQLIAGLMDTVATEIRNQIIRIEDYIDELVEKLSGLWTQLEAYE